MVAAFKKYASVDLEKNLTQEEIIPTAKAKGYATENATWEQLFNQIYLNEVEPNLGQGKPTILYDFPSPMAALAKKKHGDPRFAERFEIFIAGLELGDAYSELSDWKEQEERFKAEVVERKRLGKTYYPYDKDFITALKVGLPRCAGLALGVDRLIMLFANVLRIQDVLFFPGSELWKS
jgi:lysyl-tRNA synthetase class 2